MPFQLRAYSIEPNIRIKVYLSVWFFVSISSLNVVDEVGNIVGQLRSGSRSSIFIIDESIIELSGHTDDHVIEVGVECFSLWNIHTNWGLVVITSQDIVDVI